MKIYKNKATGATVEVSDSVTVSGKNWEEVKAAPHKGKKPAKEKTDQEDLDQEEE